MSNSFNIPSCKNKEKKTRIKVKKQTKSKNERKWKKREIEYSDIKKVEKCTGNKNKQAKNKSQASINPILHEKSKPM